MTVVVKDQYGDPFYSTAATTIGVTSPGNIDGLTALTTPIGATNTKGEYAFNVAINATTGVEGQSGVVVFRDVDGNVIGNVTLVTSNNNVTASTKLVVTNGPTNNTIDSEIASNSAITYEIHKFNSAGVDVGVVTPLTNLRTRGRFGTCEKVGLISSKG
ncbi:hypothetical protein LNN31_04230 [Acetobacterium wieringae]|uniref:Big-1 domain-containing protein n=1 Tax=Acetobacterium wieringae TaxID=52694 RepID=A0ABY6HGV9_9FIRM|nr:hypothetical protein [Acetobacterium wieringae]UYO63647.1 hypothetical protein LNN31_04230 [Acetobacterium wieringae]